MWNRQTSRLISTVEGNTEDPRREGHGRRCSPPGIIFRPLTWFCSVWNHQHNHDGEENVRSGWSLPLVHGGLVIPHQSANCRDGWLRWGQDVWLQSEPTPALINGWGSILLRHLSRGLVSPTADPARRRVRSTQVTGAQKTPASPTPLLIQLLHWSQNNECDFHDNCSALVGGWFRSDTDQFALLIGRGMAAVWIWRWAFLSYDEQLRAKQASPSCLMSCKSL